MHFQASGLVMPFNRFDFNIPPEHPSTNPIVELLNGLPVSLCVCACDTSNHKSLFPLFRSSFCCSFSFCDLSEGEKKKEEQVYKNVNLLIIAYIAVHLPCCCYANTLGVYFLNPSEERPGSWPPAVPFEYGVAAVR